MFSIFEFIKNNFWHVAPILLTGVFALAIIIERCRALYWVFPINNEEKFFDGIQDTVMKGKIAEAIALCDRHPTKPMSKVVKTALLRAHQPKEMIEDGLAIAVEEASQKIVARTSFLAMVANVATLFGLLGTIIGLIHSFEAVSQDNATQKTMLLAKGISEAMNATVMGLAVAIPAMIAFSFLMNRSNKLVSSLESSAVRVLDILKQRYFESESKVVGRDGSRGVA